jgi:hypothetical protein
MTELVREARSRLKAIGESRQRPYTFAVHVLDSPAVSLELGLDVEAWLAEGLVDVLVVGMGYMPYVLRLDQWLALGNRFRVPVYPSVNTNIYVPWWKEKFGRPSAWHEAIRASSAYFRQEGADGLYLFNLFCLQDKHVGPMPRDFVYAPLREIGDPTLLTGKDKLYAIQPSSDSGFCHHGSEATPLPIPLDRAERKLPLMMGPDANDSNAHFRISAWSTGGSSERHIWFRLNHALLEKPGRDGPWYRVAVPSGVLRSGHNELSIWCDAEVSQMERPIIIHQVFVEAGYGRGSPRSPKGPGVE